MSTSDRKVLANKGAYCAMVFLLGLALCSLTLGSTLFDYYEQVFADGHRKELQRELGLSLTPGVGPGSLRPERLGAVRAELTPMFQALPKNKIGRISAEVMRNAADRYFVHKYGWYVKGFEAHRGNGADLTQVHVLRTKVPGYCESALKGRLSVVGFSLDDASTLVAGVEQLIFDEGVANVELAYGINDFPVTGLLPKEQMRSVIDSVLLETIFERNFSDKVVHDKAKNNPVKAYPGWKATSLFVDDVIGSDAFERKQTNNPFARGARKGYAFEDTARVATRISGEFGRWSNHECLGLKASLASMDKHSTGRVKLSDFYSAHAEDGAWQFLESADYLRKVGALDEVDSSLGPQVIIPNYLLGANNCIMSTPHYSVCCLSECEGVLRQIEARILGPSGSVAKVREAVERVTATPISPAALNGSLLERLEEAAAHNGGVVPIHGRFFAQILHYTFPQECPYPHAPGSLDQRTLEDMTNTIGAEVAVVHSEDLAGVLKELHSKKFEPPSPVAGANMWVAQETLLRSSTPSDEMMGWFAHLVSTLLTLAFVLIMVAAAMQLPGLLFAPLHRAEETKLLVSDAAFMA